MDLPAKTITPRELEASICRDSLYDFLQRFWPVLIPEDPVWNWHIKVLCDELQKVACRVFRREPKEYDLIVNVSPGSTKSTICSVVFPAWCWANDPTIRLICGSYAKPLSYYLATLSLRVVQSDKYRWLYPEIEFDKETEGLIMLKQGGQRFTTATGAAVTGMHGHIIVVDDPLNPKEAVSEVMLRGANDWMDQTLMTRMIDRRITPVILIMQRLHENDPTGHFLERRATTPIRHIRLPARLTDGPVLPRILRHQYVNGLFDPVRLPEEVCKKAEAELGPYAYAGQYGQMPIPLVGGLFRIDQLKVLPTPGAAKRTVRYWDKAGTSDAGCFTVGLRMALYGDKDIVVEDVVRGQWEANARERIIQATAQRDGRKIPVAVEVEPGSAGKDVGKWTLKNLRGWRVHLDRPTGSKEDRAVPFASQVNGGNVALVKGDWNAAYMHELQHFPNSKYKDQVDASSGAFFDLVGRHLRVGGL